jgi:hypothetical protein
MVFCTGGVVVQGLIYALRSLEARIVLALNDRCPRSPGRCTAREALFSVTVVGSDDRRIVRITTRACGPQGLLEWTSRRSRVEHQTHDDDVPELAVPTAPVSAEATLDDETVTLVQLQRSFVVRPHRQRDLVSTVTTRPLDARIEEASSHTLTL